MVRQGKAGEIPRPGGAGLVVDQQRRVLVIAPCSRMRVPSVLDGDEGRRVSALGWLLAPRWCSSRAASSRASAAVQSPCTRASRCTLAKSSETKPGISRVRRCAGGATAASKGGLLGCSKLVSWLNNWEMGRVLDWFSQLRISCSLISLKRARIRIPQGAVAEDHVEQQRLLVGKAAEVDGKAP